MAKFLGFSCLPAGAASFAFAGTATAPEIDGASAITAVVLLSGGLPVLRARVLRARVLRARVLPARRKH